VKALFGELEMLFPPSSDSDCSNEGEGNEGKCSSSFYYQLTVLKSAMADKQTVLEEHTSKLESVLGRD